MIPRTLDVSVKIFSTLFHTSLLATSSKMIFKFTKKGEWTGDLGHLGGEERPSEESMALQE